MYHVRGMQFPSTPRVFCLPTYSYLKQIKYLIIRAEAEKVLKQCRDEIMAMREELETLFEQEGNLLSPKVIQASQLLDQKISSYYLQQKKKDIFKL